MFGLFKSKPLISDEDRQFQVDTFKWLLTHFGGDDFYQETILVLPTKAHFPDSVTSEQEAVESTFARVKDYAGMSEWNCLLERQEVGPDPRVAEFLTIQNVPAEPLGTFSMNDSNDVIISYHPDIVRNPTNLVATFAHELAHYLTGGCEDPPPGGWENWEFATDIAAVFMGFGIFMANSAFSFRQYQSAGAIGWQTQRNGYLSEAEYAYALAVFCALKGLDPKSPLPYLDRNIRKLVSRANNEIRAMDVIQEILSADLPAAAVRSTATRR